VLLPVENDRRLFLFFFTLSAADSVSILA